MKDETPSAAGLPTPSATHLVHSLMHFLRVVQRRWVMVASATIVVAALGVVYYLTATPIYEARSELLIMQTGRGVMAPEMAGYSQNLNLIPTYEKLFGSKVVLERACQKLEQMPPAARIDLVQYPRGAWPSMLAESIRANGVRNSNIIDVSYRSRDPRAAEVIVDVVTEAYLEFMKDKHKSVAQEILEVLQVAKTEVEDRIRDREQALRYAKEQLRSMGLTGNERTAVVHPVVQRAISLNQSLIAVTEKRVRLQAAARAIRAAMAHGGDIRQYLGALDDVVGREMWLSALGLNAEDSKSLAEIQKEAFDHEKEMENLLKHLGPQHSRIIKLRRSIAKTKAYLAHYYDSKVNPRLQGMGEGELGPVVLKLVDSELIRIRDHEAELHQAYQIAETEAVQMNDKMSALQAIEREMELLRNRHDMYLNRISSIELRGDTNAVRMAIVSEPLAGDAPVAPNLALVTIICLLGGLGGGGMIVYVLDVLDDRFRSPEELKEEIGAPVLAMIRQLPVLTEVGVDSVRAYVAPDSVESEAFRTLRTTLTFSSQEMNCVVVTSAEPSDGKTTVLANLGVSYALAGKRTLLIDSDMRRPGLSKLFDVRGLGGLSEILRANGELGGDTGVASDNDLGEMCRQRIHPTPLETLDVLPCGPKPTDPAELLSGSRLTDLLAWAVSQYDQVLVDSPPMLAASDAAIIGRVADGAILGVQPEKNHRRLVLRAAEGLTSMKVRLAGVVANKIGPDRGGYSYGYGYGYGEGYGAEEESESFIDAGIGSDDDSAYYDEDDYYDDGEEVGWDHSPDRAEISVGGDNGPILQEDWDYQAADSGEQQTPEEWNWKRRPDDDWQQGFRRAA